MDTTISQNNSNFYYGNDEIGPEVLESLHKLGFKLVALSEEGLPIEAWTSIYENSDYWKESDFTNPVVSSKFKNIASTTGKTHLKDPNGTDL
ncbi:MAG: hypothetical protein P0116_15855, partial [Candidatus Nitrosocosmicus sp.]|nr:hypothetical protein [Candidatus Nitrosocosmicus sp.]